MFLLIRNQTDPYFNLAAEEYFIRNGPDNMIMFWQNERSVIIGKHQNPYAETDFNYLTENQIPVIRRISGGGTVYHDPGNINFSFIRKVGTVNPVNFSQFTRPILELLLDLGIPASEGPRNNLLVDGLKFSGNAEHVFRDKVLHHGTLLFNTDLEILNNCLDTAGNRIASKAVPSVRSRVTNLSAYLNEQVSAGEFLERLVIQLRNKLEITGSYELTNCDLDEINKLADTKYRSWDWNFGYSPVYSLEVLLKTTVLEFNFQLKVEQGRITEVVSSPVPAEFPWLQEMNLQLIHCRHGLEDIGHIARQFSHELSEAGLSGHEFIAKFF